MAKRRLVSHRAIAAALGLGIISALIIAGHAQTQPPKERRVYAGKLTQAGARATAPLIRRTPIVGLWDDETGAWVPKPSPTPSPTPTPRPKPRATRAPATPRPVAIRTSHSLKGKASWYCKAGVSVCHYAYPPGSMVAAACAPLRSAIGPSWRGRRVVVVSRSTGRSVVVKLVDWCSSREKTIDLYWEPMRRLGGTGVLPVTVKW